MAPVEFILETWQAVLICLLFSVIFVGSLYVWADSVNKNRDHPETIKRRFASIAVISIIVPCLLYYFASTSENAKAHSFCEWLGIRLSGIVPSIILPLVLTMALFLGPLTQHYMDGIFSLYLEPRYWTNSLQNLIWLRNHLVAPFSEEFIYRACMLPLLVPCFGSSSSVFFCPLLFGVAHIHHLIERIIQAKQELKVAIKQTLFQLTYTTLFGAYSAFLFLRTGHLMAPVVAHAFCNHMGFPAFGEVLHHPNTATRHKLFASYVLGLILWLALLFPLTSPFLYANEIYDL